MAGPYRQINARDLIFEVSDMAVTPVWTAIGALTDGGVDPSANESMTETTTWDDDGNFNQEKMQVGASLSLSGKALSNPTTGARDPGQALCHQHNDRLGPASQIDVRFRYPGATDWTVWTSTLSVGEESGGANDKTGFSVTVTRCGPATTQAVS